jgi:peptidoglycan-associated lipoprotein
MRPVIAPSSFLTVSLFAALGALAGCGGPQYPNCNNDSQCHQGEFCVNGTCQQCRPGGNDCPAGQQCVGGRCDAIPGYCGSSADCPSGQECRGNRCVTVAVSRPEPEPEQRLCSMQSVYFEFDSSELDESARAALSTNAQCIQQRNMQSVQATGYADPRGTEEYNLALGERRARSVQSYLGNSGVDSSRLGVHSVGEEMAGGSDEASWARDRRVEIGESR